MLSDVNYWCRHEYVQMNMSCPYLRLLPVIITRPSQTQPSQKVCQLFQGSAAIVKPIGCCGAQQQCCCLDTRIACPPNEDVPCICTLLPFCVVCANWGMKFKCCGKVKDVIGSSAKAPAAATAPVVAKPVAAPQPQAMNVTVNVSTGAPESEEMER